MPIKLIFKIKWLDFFNIAIVNNIISKRTSTGINSEANMIKNKPIKLGKYTMVTQSAQNLKKVGAALIGDKDVKRIA